MRKFYNQGRCPEFEGSAVRLGRLATERFFLLSLIFGRVEHILRPEFQLMYDYNDWQSQLANYSSFVIVYRL